MFVHQPRAARYYIDRLIETPSNHDKVEFEIILSCYTLDMKDQLTRLRAGGLGENDCEKISQSLLALTNQIIGTKNGIWREDRAKIDTLDERRRGILGKSLDTVSKIYWLIPCCGRRSPAVTSSRNRRRSLRTSEVSLPELVATAGSGTRISNSSDE